MEDIAKLLDGLLLDFVAYPTTLWNLVASPARVFHPEPGAMVTSPAVTYVFSGFLTYVAFSILGARLRFPKQLDKLISKLREPGVWATALVIYIALLANVQRWIIASLADVSLVPLTDQLHVLVYAFCPAVVLGAIYLAVKALWPRPAVDFLGFLTAFLYMFTLWQGCRVALGLSAGRATIAAVTTTLISIVVVNVAAIGLVWILNRVDDTSPE
jgi:hypothetical protein